MTEGRIIVFNIGLVYDSANCPCKGQGHVRTCLLITAEKPRIRGEANSVRYNRALSGNRDIK